MKGFGLYLIILVCLLAGVSYVVSQTQQTETLSYNQIYNYFMDGDVDQYDVDDTTLTMNLKKENRVAILLDNLSLAGLRQFPLETTGDHSYNAVMRWLADALYRRNIEFDMVSSGERDFSAYDFLVVPALYAASDDLLGALDRYVAEGGHLIATFRTGFVRHYGPERASGAL